MAAQSPERNHSQNPCGCNHPLRQVSTSCTFITSLYPDASLFPAASVQLVRKQGCYSTASLAGRTSRSQVVWASPVLLTSWGCRQKSWRLTAGSRRINTTSLLLNAYSPARMYRQHQPDCLTHYKLHSAQKSQAKQWNEDNDFIHSTDTAAWSLREQGGQGSTMPKSKIQIKLPNMLQW